MILRKPFQIVIHTCMQTTLAFFINIRTLQKLKMFSTRNLQMRVNGVLIISCQFTLVKIKLNAFFSVGKKLPELNITYDSNRTKQFHIAEYLRCHLHANLSGEPMAMNFIRRSIRSYSSSIDKMSF